METMIGELKSAFTDAMGDLKQMTGTPANQDVAVYGKLKSHHFDAVRMRYGLGGLADYVKKMEMKREGVED